MTGKQFSLWDNDYWLPYDTIVSNIPESGKIPIATLKKRVHEVLKQYFPDTVIRKKKPVKITIFPNEEFYRLIECEVVGFDGLTAWRKVS